MLKGSRHDIQMIWGTGESGMQNDIWGSQKGPPGEAQGQPAICYVLHTSLNLPQMVFWSCSTFIMKKKKKKEQKHLGRIFNDMGNAYDKWKVEEYSTWLFPSWDSGELFMCTCVGFTIRKARCTNAGRATHEGCALPAIFEPASCRRQPDWAFISSVTPAETTGKNTLML